MATLNISLPDEAQVLVGEGESVNAGDVLAKGSKKTTHIVEMATLLSIEKKKLPKFLTLPIGSAVAKGEVIARRRRFFTEMVIRAPFAANIKGVDLSRGTIELIKKGETSLITSPLKAKVEAVSKTSISLSFSGEVVKTIRCSGYARGKLYLSKNKSYHDIDKSVEGRIVALYELEMMLISKVAALDAAGIITSEKIKDPDLPFAIIDKKTINSLHSSSYSYAIIDGLQNFLALAEE